MSVRRLRGWLRALRWGITSLGPQPGDMIVVETLADMTRDALTN